MPVVNHSVGFCTEIMASLKKKEKREGGEKSCRYRTGNEPCPEAQLAIAHFQAAPCLIKPAQVQAKK